MEKVGFEFEKLQKPHLQKRKENELKFIHPKLVKKLEQDGFKVRGKKFYLKPLSDSPECEIGFVTGKTSPLYTTKNFIVPNTIDSFESTPAWTNKEGDAAFDNLLESIEHYLDQPVSFIQKISKSFLFTWNPNKWDWKDLQEDIELFGKVGYIDRRWSCGNSKSIQKGDRVFLLKFGEAPRGIMASGYAKSSFYTAPHWDGNEGKTTNYIDIEFDVIINPHHNNIFDEKYLKKIDPGKVQEWFPQQSGISIKSEVVETLESQWFDFIVSNNHIGQTFLSNDVTNNSTDTFLEGRAKDIVQTRYERNPEARKRCLSYYGYSCQICKFNFETCFGDIGKGFIHVHHINQISKMGGEYSISPINDLIPVCPNCHAMIHSKREPFTIEDIKLRLNNNKT
ncbi:HNH endonuclease [Flavobacterium ardleyense]|uniref:HNH endonuclease n=1 Tax=Flavobacterium ardleyense TaxID=2038737 RepID=UPI00298D1B42|nr:HNH endonuclease [Flavobacterium ardleyense]